MAYVDFSSEFQTTGYASFAKPELARLTGDERQAVLLARTDDLSSLHSHGRSRRVIDRIFGFREPNKLADPRLEALRSFAVSTARSSSQEADSRPLEALGFGSSQIDEARAIALRFRPRQRSRRPYVEMALGWLSGATAYVLLRPELTDSVTTAVVSAILSLPIFSMARPRTR